MPRVDLTARLARESKSTGRDVILFDKALPGFGLRIHPSSRKVWIVQARIEGRSRRIVIARHREMELVETRRHARNMLARIRAGDNPADDIQREKKAPRSGSSQTSTCGAASRTGSPRSARPCTST